MADAVVLNALKRFFTKEEVDTAYKAAFSAYQERATEVVITSAQFEGGGSNGQIAGDPRELMEACEVRLQEIAAEEAGEAAVLPGPNHVDFSQRFIGT